MYALFAFSCLLSLNKYITYCIKIDTGIFGKVLIMVHCTFIRDLPSCAPLPSSVDPDSVTLSNLMKVTSGSSARLSFKIVREIVATDCPLENST